MFKGLFGKKKGRYLRENEVRIILPEESYTLIEYQDEGLPCVASVNSGLVDFEHKEIFRWHLSLIIDFDEVVDKGMPSEDELKIVNAFCDKLDEEIKAGGNALFLVRETWNKTRRLVWRVYNPEIAHQHLQYILEHHRYPRQFDYRIEDDVEWKQAEWYFSALKE